MLEGDMWMGARETSIATRTATIRTYYPVTNNWLSDSKDILLRFLRAYFAQMPAGQCRYIPGQYLYGGEGAEEQTEIIITEASTIATSTVEKRPAIIVSRTPFQYSNLGMDNFLSWSHSTATRKHTDLVTGQFYINCISRSGIEAETLALYVAKGIKFYRRFLQRYGYFQVGQRVAIGAESPANSFLGGDSDEDFINVAISLPVMYQETWSIGPTETNTLKNIMITLQSIMRRPDGSLLYADSIDSSGNVNSSSNGVIIETWTYTSGS